MAAAEKTITTRTLVGDGAVCRQCLGTGTVSLWNEIAYFEDRRACQRCDDGRRVDSKISDILKRAQLEERLSGG